MSRDELILRLALLEREGKISRAEAITIRELFDAGKIDGSELPLTREEERLRLLTALGLATAAGHLLTVRQRFGNRGDTSVRLDIVGLLDSTLSGVSQRPQSRRIRTWHDEMSQLIVEHSLAMAEIGARRQLTDRERRQVLEALRPQFGYLERFADEIAFRSLTDNPMSQAQIYDRSRQYGGFALGLFYRLREARFEGIRGWVVDYIPRDDQGTCIPCHESGRGSPFLPGQGPFPGEVCVAHGKCRCERVLRFDITAWRILTNELPRGRSIALL